MKTTDGREILLLESYAYGKTKQEIIDNLAMEIGKHVLETAATFKQSLNSNRWHVKIEVVWPWPK